jgi:tyrosyl-tRNA synthetase
MTAPANDMFGKLMSLPDLVMRTYFEALTEVSKEELDEFDRKMVEGTLNPRNVKLRMAREIVTEFHTAEAAREAEEAFIRQFSERKLPADIPDYVISMPRNIVDAMVDAKLASSNNKARELLKQNAVSLFPQGETSASQRITDSEYTLDPIDGAILKVGKRQYIRLRKP